MKINTFTEKIIFRFIGVEFYTVSPDLGAYQNHVCKACRALLSSVRNLPEDQWMHQIISEEVMSAWSQ